MRGQVRKAYKVMLKLIDPRIIKDDQIPLDMIKKAKALVFVTTVKAGFFVSGSAGGGIIIRKLKNGHWSPPSSVGLSGVGFGAQLGFSSTDTVLVLTTEKAVETFFNRSQIKLGGHINVALGPLGREAESSLATKVNVPGYKKHNLKKRTRERRGRQSFQSGLKDVAENIVSCYSYSHSKGLFAGVSVQGAVLIHRHTDNREYYGKEIKVVDIMEGKVPAEDLPFDRYLHLLHQSLKLVIGKADEDESPEEIRGGENVEGTEDTVDLREAIDKELEEISRRKTLEKLGEPTRLARAKSNKIHSAKVPKQLEGIERKYTLITRRMTLDRVPKAKAEKVEKQKVPEQIEQEEEIDLEKTLNVIEYEWVRELQLLTKDSGLIPNGYFDDFELAMFALLAEGDLARAIVRMEKVMKYVNKEKLRVQVSDLSLPQNDSIKALMGKMLLHCGRDLEGSPIIALNLGNYWPKDYDTQVKIVLQALIFTFRIFVVNIDDFRNGIVVVADCKEASKENAPGNKIAKKLKAILRVTAEGFPVPIKRIIILDAPNAKTVKILINTVGKMFVPKAIRKAIEFGTRSELGNVGVPEELDEHLGGKLPSFSDAGLTFDGFISGKVEEYESSLKMIVELEKRVEAAKLFPATE
eukprot:augustus_masked-scaffold_14-processed-gene-3.2-mRNA-1 protein AED:0.45 eAED:0.45 QI:0/-1/0/1/-1/1/1/0/637